MKTVEYTLPESWLSAFINGDMSGYSPEEESAIDAFTAYMVGANGACWAVSCTSEEDEDHPGFLTYHDARAFYPYAADCSRVTFHILEA